MLPENTTGDVPALELPVGTVAARLGVSAATVRSWGSRYGLLPTIRTAGGHRRYSEHDVARLIRMQALVSQGATPANAARAVQAGDPQDAPDRDGGDDRDGDGARQAEGTTRRRAAGRKPGGPGGRVLAVPNGSPAARGLARAAGRLDTGAILQIVGRLLEADGAQVTWDDVLRPVLAAAGAAWARNGTGIDIEHVLSECVIDAMRAHRAAQPAPLLQPPVVLAGSSAELHVLPLHVIAAALAEQRVPTLLLGARVPGAALASAVRRTRAAAVFLWRQRFTDAVVESVDLTPMRPAVQVIVGGPGWEDVELPASARLVPDLATAVQALTAAART